MVKVERKPIEKPADRILIQGKVTVWQGKGKNKIILVKKAENHWVDVGLKGLISALVGSYVYLNTWSGWADGFGMYLGSDTATTTTHGMTSLVSPIGTAPGTGPSSTSGASLSNPATGTWKISFTGIWYAGVVSGTVGEMALYLKPFNIITPSWSKHLQSPNLSSAMVSRLSATDGDFAGFAIDTSKSLTVQWEITITYV